MVLRIDNASFQRGIKFCNRDLLRVCLQQIEHVIQRFRVVHAHPYVITSYSIHYTKLYEAGYDVYYEEQDAGTHQRFIDGIKWAVEKAAASQVMLAVEIMDTPYMNSITKWKVLEAEVQSPWFTVYPDVGNLTAWGNDVPAQLALGINQIAAIHLKDTYSVTAIQKGQFRSYNFV